MIRIVFKYLNALFYSVSLLRKSRENIFKYRIEELDLNKNYILLYCYGVRTILYTKITDVVTDSFIINNLSPIQSCWLGYNYGKLQCELNKLKNHNINFNLRSDKGRFKILSEENNGEINYTDKYTKKIYRCCPIKISLSDNLICHFDPSQAFYIGMLSGLSITNSQDHEEKPKLRLVK